VVTTVFVQALVAAATLAGWLPQVGPQFTAWGNPHAAYHATRDSFVCAKSAPKSGADQFDYPASTCPWLASGTPFVFGSGEPQRGKGVYDPAHRIALYDAGCCAGRTYVLAAGVSPPPVPLQSADLSGVRTQRGAGLGMTIQQVEKIYGAATPYAVGTGANAATVLSYATFASDPVHSEEPCGQYQSFAFRDAKAYAIEIYVGC